MTYKRLGALLLCLLVLLPAGCGRRTPDIPDDPAPVDIYRSSWMLWDRLPPDAAEALKEAYRLHMQAYNERFQPLSDLIFARLVKSDLSAELRIRAVADEFARGFLRCAWSANIPDAPVVSAQIVVHPDPTLATQGDRAKYDRLAIVLTDELGNRYLVCFDDWTALLYRDGELLASCNTSIIH